MQTKDPKKKPDVKSDWGLFEGEKKPSPKKTKTKKKHSPLSVHRLWAPSSSHVHFATLCSLLRKKYVVICHDGTTHFPPFSYHTSVYIRTA